VKGSPDSGARKERGGITIRKGPVKTQLGLRKAYCLRVLDLWQPVDKQAALYHGHRTEARKRYQNGRKEEEHYNKKMIKNKTQVGR